MGVPARAAGAPGLEQPARAEHRLQETQSDPRTRNPPAPAVTQPVPPTTQSHFSPETTVRVPVMVLSVMEKGAESLPPGGGYSRGHHRESHPEACCVDILKAPLLRPPCQEGQDWDDGLGGGSVTALPGRGRGGAGLGAAL